MSSGIGGYVATPATYGGFASTVGNEAMLMNQRYNPFRYLQTGQGLPMQQGMPMQAPVPPSPVLDGFAAGGAVGSALGRAGDATTLLDLLLSIGGQGATRRGDAAPDAGPQPYVGSDGTDGATAASSPRSGADYGPIGSGGVGLSPGRSGGFGLGPIGNAVASKALGMAIPGAGLISSVGNAFNAGARSSQLADAAGQIAGKEPGTQGIGAFLGGAFGIGATKDGDFGQAAMSHNLSPDEAATALSNYNMTGDINATQQQIAAAQANQAAAQAAANMPGAGIAGVAGAATSGASATGLNMGPSAGAFGQGFAGPASGLVGNDGVASVSGTPGADFGSTTGTGGDSGGQSGQGANSGNGGSGASGGGQSGNGADNGSGDGANWRGGRIGYAGGGVIRSMAGNFFTKKLAHGSGLVGGISSGRADKVHVSVPHGAYVVPADVVSGMGQGNTAAGGTMLARMMPKSPGLHFAAGGIAGEPGPVPIQVSPGEFVVHPAHVAAIGGGNPQAGSAALDQMVQGVRQQNMQVAAGMPPPR